MVLSVVGIATPAAAVDSASAFVGTITGPDGSLLGPQDRVEISVHDPRWNNIVASTIAEPGTGQFELPIPAGSYPVSFRYTGPSGLLSEWWGDTYSASDRELALVEPAVSTRLDVRLGQGATLSGRVTGRGGSLAGVAVEVALPSQFDQFLNPLPKVVTAADGSYMTAATPPGARKVTFTGGTGWKTVIQPSVELAEGANVLDVDLTPLGSISGRVTMRSRGDVVPAHGQVEIHRLSQFGWGWTGWSVWIEEDGSYTVPNLEGDVKLRFVPFGGAFPEYWNDAEFISGAEIITIAGGEHVSGVDAEVDEWAFAHAEVRYQADATRPPQPLDSVSVSWWLLDEDSGTYSMAHDAGNSPYDGTYSSPPLREGTYAVQFAADPYSGVGSEYYAGARYFYERTDVVVKAGERIDLGEIILEPRYFDISRIAGADRFETAVSVSKTLIPNGQHAPVVYLADGMNFPDALAAGPAAARNGGVLLMTRKDAVPAAVLDEIRRLEPERVVIVGGTSVVSDDVIDDLRAVVGASVSIERLGGASRYATAELIIRDAFDDSTSRYAVIATGADYPDALAAGPAAGLLAAPVVLVNGSAAIDQGTTALLDDLGVTDVYIVGGDAVVGSEIEEGLTAALGYGHVTRLAGRDRYETAASIASEVFGASDTAYMATGLGFADALAGGPLASAAGAPLYLARPECVPAPTLLGLLEHQVAGVTLLGGVPTLGRAVEQLAMC
ncbi:cell wall-binding repeat-containing protein [Agromyces subbeticus]|uniref:cell wall-binding repeat-containing protein n=1 Tax=Agromyces subbeticus TaxID=293890 RepID=UPI0012EC0C8E|nr:cell wall-binding repeat-containing protein [Agromyces subbeticus]